MFRLFQNPKTIPEVDLNNKLSLVVGLSNLIINDKSINILHQKLKQYEKNQKYIRLMPLPIDKYKGNNIISTIRNIINDIDENYVKLIEDDCIELDDYNIIITPLYTNFNAHGLPSKYKYLIKKIHPDFSNIYYMQKNLQIDLLTPDNVLSDFNYSFNWIKNNLKTDRKNIIYTIWSPVKITDENDILSAYYSNSLDMFIKEHPEICMWVSSNSLNYSDFNIGSTNIYNLPRNKEFIYDYDKTTNGLYYIKKIKRRNKN